MPAHPDFELLQAYLDDALDPACRIGFEERLTREPALAEELVRLAREDAIYIEWVRSSAVAAKTQPFVTPRSRRRSRRWLVAAAIVTAVASVGVLAFVLNGAGRLDPGPALATLEDVQGAVDVVSAGGQVRTALDGQSLYSGQEVRTGEDGSSTVIRLQDTRLVLAAETRIQLRSNATVSDAGGPLVFVAEGMVAAEVVRRDAKPMVLHSQYAELRGSAGRFSFVSLPDATVIEADDGAGRFTRKSDGQSIEVRRGQWATSASNEPFRVKDLTARLTTPRRTLQDTGPVLGLLFDAEGGRLTSCAGDAIKRWDLVTGKSTPVVRTQKKKPIKLVTAAADGKLAALAYNDNQLVKVFELATGAERAGHKGLKRVAALALSPDSSLLAISWTSGKEGHEVRLYDTALGVERVLHTDNSGAVQSLVFSPKGGLLATAADRAVKVWDARSGNLVRAVSKLPADPRALAFSPDGGLLAIGDRKGNIRVIDALTGSEKAFLSGHLRDVCSLSFSPDGQTIVSGAADGTAKLWVVADGREVTTIKAHGNAIGSVAYSPDGRVIATGGSDRKIMVWDVPPVAME